MAISWKGNIADTYAANKFNEKGEKKRKFAFTPLFGLIGLLFNDPNLAVCAVFKGGFN